MFLKIETQSVVVVAAATAMAAAADVVVNCIDRIATRLSTNQTKHRPFNIHCLLRAPVIRRYFIHYVHKCRCAM